MWPLFVILWRQYLLRKRSWIFAILEVLYPILFLLMIYSMGFSVGGQKSETQLYNRSSLTMDSTNLPLRVLYTPQTKFTDALMDRVGAKLHLLRLSHLTDDSEKGYTPLEESELFKYRQKWRRSDAIVIFHKHVILRSGEPKKIQYTIRISADFETNSYEPPDNYWTAHRKFGTIYEPFLHLQWAIDTSYLNLITGTDFNQTLTLVQKEGDQPLTPGVLMICYVTLIYCRLAPLLAYSSGTSFLVADRDNGMHEMMKMAGVTINAIVLGTLIGFLPVALVYGLAGVLMFKLTARPFGFYTSGAVILPAFVLHYMSVVSLGLPLGFLINNKEYAKIIPLAIYGGITLITLFALNTPTPEMEFQKEHRALVLLQGLLPHKPFDWFWKQVSLKEMFDQPATDLSITNVPGVGSLGEAYLFLLLQIALSLLAAWYLAHLFPGRTAVGLPPCFLCSKRYWRVSPKVEDVQQAVEKAQDRDERYFEEPPRGAHVGIRILNVTKAFEKQVALSNVSLDVFKGEITVLLGHNGAGKTTLMSIITGSLQPTSGTVLVNGMDVRWQHKKVRSLLGLCPQYSIFVVGDVLTVLDYLKLFNLLKGATFGQADKASRELIKKFKMNDKKDTSAGALSGGLMRRLQIACTLCGDADVILMDEPTSGLDVQTRRELWDILLSLRGDRTLLMSTHFMEEADALGDRVAALHAGRLKCYATTMFLKRAVGAGYRISFTTFGQANEHALTDVIKTTVPDVTVRNKSKEVISFNLPAKDSSQFPALFATIENKKSELGIKSIAIGKSSLDEVFVKVCSDFSALDTEEVNPLPEPAHKTLSGCVLHGRQFVLLIGRQCRFVISCKLLFGVMLIMFPLIVVTIRVTSSNNPAKSASGNRKAAMDLDLYSDMPHARAFSNVKFADAVPALRNGYDKVEFEKAEKLNDVMLRSVYLGGYLVGIDGNNTHVTAVYSTAVRHAAPVAVNLVSNLLASQRLGHADGRTITTYNHPLRDPNEIIQPKDGHKLNLLFSDISAILFLITCGYVVLPCREVLTSMRHIYQMGNCPVTLYWMATLTFNVCFMVIFVLLPTIIIVLIFEKDHTINQFNFLGSWFAVMALGTLTHSAFLMLYTMDGKEAIAVFVTIYLIVFSGFVVPRYLPIIQNSFLIPIVTVIDAARDQTAAARLNALCNLNMDKCPNLNIVEEGFDAHKCCESSGSPVSYFRLGAAGKSMIALACFFLVYFILTIIADHKLFHKCISALWQMVLGVKNEALPLFNHPAVVAEKELVRKRIAIPKHRNKEAILCHDIYRTYVSCCSAYKAVRGISFSVKKGEIFGLLGVNGAGKSTVFKVLTKQSHLSHGTIYSDGISIGKKSQYLSTLGYCPQTLGSDEFLTARQSLRLLLKMRGVHSRDAELVSMWWIKEIGLEKYADQRVSKYSGGCARRLAVAEALCQQARTTLLDEPTAGVDPVASRRVHAAIKRAKESGRSIIVTSHSMLEMEEICDRVCIIGAGQVCAIGSTNELRAQHAKGYAVVFKLNINFASTDDDTNKDDAAAKKVDKDGAVARKADKDGAASRKVDKDGAASRKVDKDGAASRKVDKDGAASRKVDKDGAASRKVDKDGAASRKVDKDGAAASKDVKDGAASVKEQFKGEMHRRFDCNLVDEHRIMMHFHINNVMPYSELFTQLEGLKTAFPQLIEDYSVSDTTLEEVFIAFAKQAEKTIERENKKEGKQLF